MIKSKHPDREVSLRIALTLAILWLTSSAAVAQPASEIALIKRQFNELQKISIRQNREYCGYLVLDSQSRLSATPATRGRRDSCQADWPEGVRVVASYHTHAAYDPDAISELPSTTDLEGDRFEGVNGYVATPGGRLWYINSATMTTRMICDVGCLTMDGRFKPSIYETVVSRYTYAELAEIQDGP